jgi:hypothetical protein
MMKIGSGVFAGHVFNEMFFFGWDFPIPAKFRVLWG